MSDLDLNDHHRKNLSSYLRFCKYQRAHRLRSVDACFQDVKDTRIVEDTYTADEIIEILDSLADVVRAEVEGELIHDTHTNSLLLSQLFGQAQKWHLDLHVDTSDLENQELIEEVRKFEDLELQGRGVEMPSPQKKTLAPLNDGGAPVALLQNRIQTLTEENNELTEKLRSLENQLSDAIKTRTESFLALQSTKEELAKLKDNVSSRPTVDDVSELSDEVEKMRLEMTSQSQMHEDTQEQLSKDLTSYKNSLMQVKSQLMLAEKELEKKFSQTGAYQNMKKMLNKKNEQIKQMRQKLDKYEPDTEEFVEE
ncbi:leucine zipper transcription factor-like protein 1 [Macrobrachium rosenbergii]|uniref:leucine zipper transcription factor-like protein 1 n=1 Tax=Macrobrachium rosenbergii TaxID=79674 RepID=UPI0034D5F028